MTTLSIGFCYNILSDGTSKGPSRGDATMGLLQVYMDWRDFNNNVRKNICLYVFQSCDFWDWLKQDMFFFFFEYIIFNEIFFDFFFDNINSSQARTGVRFVNQPIREKDVFPLYS